MDRSMNSAKRLDDLYNDEDQMRKEEINKIAGPNEFTEFYSRLRQIKEFHRIRPEDVAKPLSFEFEQMNIMVRQNEDLPSKFLIPICSEREIICLLHATWSFTAEK